MDNMEIYTHEQFGEIRTIVREKEVWFVAADICNALDIKNTTDAIKRLDVDEKSRFNLGLSGGATNCVNECGLYNLILASRKPEARSFKRWITHEVLPDIRQHGVYMTPAKLEEVILNPDIIIRIATELKKARKSGMPFLSKTRALLCKTPLCSQRQIILMSWLIETCYPIFVTRQGTRYRAKGLHFFLARGRVPLQNK